MFVWLNTRACIYMYIVYHVPLRVQYTLLYRGAKPLALAGDLPFSRYFLNFLPLSHLYGAGTPASA